MSSFVTECGDYARITSSQNISPTPARLIGVVVASTSSGTIQFFDDTGTGTSTPVTGVITPTAGQFIPIRAKCGAGIYAAIANTLDCTVIYEKA